MHFLFFINTNKSLSEVIFSFSRSIRKYAQWGWGAVGDILTQSHQSTWQGGRGASPWAPGVETPTGPQCPPLLPAGILRIERRGSREPEMRASPGGAVRRPRPQSPAQGRRLSYCCCVWRPLAALLSGLGGLSPAQRGGGQLE